MSRRLFNGRFPLNEQAGKHNRPRGKSEGKHGEKTLDRTRQEKPAENDSISAWTDFFRSKSWNSRWLNLTCTLWSLIQGDSSRHISLEDLSNMLASLIWRIDGDVSSVEFSRLFEEWLKLDDPWQLSENHKLEPASLYNFRRLCMKWSLSCADVYDMILMLTIECLNRICPHSESCPLGSVSRPSLLRQLSDDSKENSKESIACTCNSDVKIQWANSIISLFSELDCMKFCRLDFDCICHFVFSQLFLNNNPNNELNLSADQIYAMTIETMQLMGAVFVDDVCPVLENHLHLKRNDDKKPKKKQDDEVAFSWMLQPANRGYVTIIGFSKYLLNYSLQGSKSLENSIQTINFLHSAVSSLNNDLNALLLLSIDSGASSDGIMDSKLIHKSASKRVASKLFGDVFANNEEDNGDANDDGDDLQLWKHLIEALLKNSDPTLSGVDSQQPSQDSDNLSTLFSVTPRRIDYSGTVDLVQQHSFGGSSSLIDRQATTAALWLRQGCWVSQSSLIYVNEVDEREMQSHKFEASCMPSVTLTFPHPFRCICLSQAKSIGLIDMISLVEDGSTSSVFQRSNHSSRLLDWIETDDVFGLATESIQSRKWCRRNKSSRSSMDSAVNSQDRHRHSSVVYSEVDLTDISKPLPVEQSETSSALSSLQQLVSGGQSRASLDISSQSWSKSISFLQFRKQTASLSLYSPEVSFMLSDAVEYIPYTWIIGILPTEAVSADVLKAYCRWQLSPLKQVSQDNSVAEEKVVVNDAIFQLFHQTLKKTCEARLCVTLFLLKFLKSFDSARRIVTSLADAKEEGHISSVGESLLSWLQCDASSNHSLTKLLSSHLLSQTTTESATDASRMLSKPPSGKRIWDLVDILEDADDFAALGAIEDESACFPIELPVSAVSNGVLHEDTKVSGKFTSVKQTVARNRTSRSRILQATIASKQRLRNIATRGLNYSNLPIDSKAVALVSSLPSEGWKKFETSKPQALAIAKQNPSVTSPSQQNPSAAMVSSGKSIDQLLGLFISQGGESAVNRDELLKKIVEIRSSESARQSGVSDMVDSTRKASETSAAHEAKPIAKKEGADRLLVSQAVRPVDVQGDGKQKLTLR